ncbi:DUF2269 family protein [Pseudomonas gingeri]|uniref:DUF2269 family protein n=1 Tax=Pseudomonas gingeri TaxID=117681 RepID=UPI0015A48D3D|nr:DUF2269 family protein [Pseudomonas gingeri]NWA01181.1 DUF2269 domain-containing protein [Pseudomonas gingeri]NWA15254.1 DUF2269 domain-containing protein [Pseudomonas gingeri]NWA53461.1 DUF2269 domain-containing protein [Pseudomonas gingeri]NWA99278.1 DUF2269 domain-containing protein [Pseudomonas gingeri]NWB04034.1 DUF2269 domain-containing protein [Pseudomonas gingeri]
METFTALKLLHGVALVLLLGGALAVTIRLWRGRRAGDTTIQHHTLRYPWFFAWMLMALCLAVLPVSGWWLVHLGGFPLGQTWLLGSSVLYTFGCLAWAWLVVRLNRLRRGEVAGSGKFTLALAIFGALCFVAIAALMGAKPA